MFNFLNNIGPTEIIIVLIVLLILFGSQIVNRIARTSGETLKEIKKAKKTFTESLEDEPKKTDKGETL